MREGNKEICHILSLMKDEVVSLSVLSEETDILPLVNIMPYLRFLDRECLESCALGTNEEASQP